jgi:hypothetical protein
MAGNLDMAAEGFRQLPEPQDASWTQARQKVRHMLARAGMARTVTPLDRQDLRGWHYVLTGGVPGSLSPYGFDAMTGRWAYLSDSVAGCAAALRRLMLILEAAGTAPGRRRCCPTAPAGSSALRRPRRSVCRRRISTQASPPRTAWSSHTT